MPKLSEFIQKNHRVVEDIFSHYKKVGDSEQSRAYLGASIIGEPCERRLWYTFRGACSEDFPGRIYRLFETGDLEEIRIVKDLRDIGCTVHDVDPATGKQFEVNDLGGHFSGHMDGCLLGLPGAEKTWHVCEFKTHNDKSYKKLVSVGVESGFPKHYAQMQAYMHKTGMKRALYFGANKNTDEMWAERIHHGKAFAEGLIEKAKRVIFSNDLPSRLSDRADWWECKFCPARELCHGVGNVLPIPSVDCRQCCHATPTLNGSARWVCSKHNRGLSKADQEKACGDHLLIPHFLNGFDVDGYGVDGETGDDFIVYSDKDGGKFANGSHHPQYVCYSTSELIGLSRKALFSPAVAEAKRLFGARITSPPVEDILSKRSEDTTPVLWSGKPEDVEIAWMKLGERPIGECEAATRVDTFDYRAVEFADKIAVEWKSPGREYAGTAEIREKL